MIFSTEIENSEHSLDQSRMFLLVVLSMVSILLPSSQSLLCTQCMSTSSDPCTGDAMNCTADQACGVSYAVSTVGGSDSTRYIRFCAPNDQCNRTGSISSPYGTIKMSTSCCTSDNCTPSIIEVPPVILASNGVTCSTCQSSYSNWCYNLQTIQCRGEETVCALHSTSIDGQISSIRGCAQPSTCNTQSYQVNGTDVVYKSVCSCGGNSSNTYCAATNASCPDETVCATVYSLTKMGTLRTERFTSMCVPIYQCGVSGSASFSEGTMKVVTLCSTNNCNLPMPELTEGSTDYNGITCRSCMAADSNCYTPETMYCTGNEHMCFLQTTYLTGNTSAKTAIRGCITTNICHLGAQTYSKLGINSAIKYICTSTSSQLCTSPSLLLALCVLMLKFMF